MKEMKYFKGYKIDDIRLVMKYNDINEVTTGMLLILPTVSVKMQNGEEYKFVVFFGRKNLVNILKEKISGR